jgi:hypothetical protein
MRADPDASASTHGAGGARLALAGLVLALVWACGGSGSSVPAAAPPAAPPSPAPTPTPAPTPPPPATPSLESVRISGASPFAPGCSTAAPNATLYVNAEVEASAAVNPVNPSNLVAAWQQDRWSDGGAQGLVGAASFDGGRTWTTVAPPFSVCAGASGAGGTPYQRATDPWVTIAADGTAYFMALAFSGQSFGANSANAMLVARSTDGGLTWSPPTTLIADAGGAHFNDKNAITADVRDARYVYAAWDRLAAGGGGPAYFTRTTDGGLTWEPARAIYDPGTSSQTIGTLPVSLPDGTLLVVFTQYDEAAGGATTATLRLVRSEDRGVTWSVPVTIAASESVGTRDPTTGQAVRDGSDLASAAVDQAGIVHVAWQDSRPNGGTRDAIVTARSTDGGRTWSAPVRVSGGGTAAAFTPNVQVRADGTIGVAYYDLRNDTPDPSALQADYWLATSTDGLSWSETHVAGPFSLTTAPNASGLFVGDYQALLAAGGRFLPVYVRTTGDLANRTDVFVAFDGD